MPTLYGVAARVLVAGYHTWEGPRVGGLHYLARFFCQQGDNVHFVTYPFPWYRAFKRGERGFGLLKRGVPKVHEMHGGKLLSLAAVTPGSFSRLDRYLPSVGRALVETLALTSFPRLDVGQYEVVVLESNESVVLLRAADAKRTRLVYRASDPLFTYTSDPYLLELECALVRKADLILSVNQVTHEALADRYGICTDRLVLWPNGFDAEIYDSCMVSPYPARSCNAVYLGAFPVDWRYIEAAARANPSITFHIIGPGLLTQKLAVRVATELPNVHYHGGLPLPLAAPFVKFADVALLPYAATPMLKYFELTSKVYQYMYCKLPIVAVGALVHLGKYGIHCASSPVEFADLVGKLAGKRISYQGFVDIQAATWTARLNMLAEVLRNRGIIG